MTGRPGWEGESERWELGRREWEGMVRVAGPSLFTLA